jgi:hypothetical protein
VRNAGGVVMPALAIGVAVPVAAAKPWMCMNSALIVLLNLLWVIHSPVCFRFVFFHIFCFLYWGSFGNMFAYLRALPFAMSGDLKIHENKSYAKQH